MRKQGLPDKESVAVLEKPVHAWKALYGRAKPFHKFLIELEIPVGATVVCGGRLDTLKYRADRVKTISITKFVGRVVLCKKQNSLANCRDQERVLYRVGHFTKPVRRLDKGRWDARRSGIHFFRTKRAAMSWL